MSCQDTNDPCGQYDCGCLNPNTFGCTSYAGAALPCLGVVNGEDGDAILTKIDAKVCNIGKVLINSDDTCPEFLFDKLEEGLNISFNITGTGCDRKLVINAVDGGVPIDVNAKVSSNDTTSGYLYSKIDTGSFLSKTIINPSGNEILKLNVLPSALISGDAGNQLTIGTDGALSTLYTPPNGSETKVVSGVGVAVSGTGTTIDPYIISTNPSIQVARSCFDSVWRPITLIATGNANVVFVSGAPQYRYRFDGTIEFKGSATYTVSFGAYGTSSDRKFTITTGNIPTTCLTAGEQAGTADLKGINYIDIPYAAGIEAQQYGYIIRKSSQNIIVEFQSSFAIAKTKTIVVNFEGAISHPSI